MSFACYCEPFRGGRQHLSGRHAITKFLSGFVMRLYPHSRTQVPVACIAIVAYTLLTRLILSPHSGHYP
jgi:hypothetical protein